MMITLHGDRGKRKAKTKAQELPFHQPLCSTSLRRLCKTIWVRGFVAAIYLAKVTVHCTCACRQRVHTWQAVGPRAC